MWADTRIWRTSALSGTETEKTKGDQTPASSIGTGALRIARLPLLYGIADVNAKTKGVFQPALLIWESAVTGRKSAAHKDVCRLSGSFCRPIS